MGDRTRGRTIAARTRRAIPRRPAHGFSLLEVLVALVVLSIGLIGLAGMQSASLRFNNDAYLRSQATTLAYDMADRVRTNAGAAALYDKRWDQQGRENVGCLGDAGCRPAQMAGDDLFRWDRRVAQLLPLGRSEICPYTDPTTLGCAANPADATDFVIRIHWDGNRDGQVDPGSPDPGGTVVVTFRP